MNPRRAVAAIKDTSGRQIGTASFEQDPESANRVRMIIDMQGLPPGTHGIHIHAVGSCDETTNPPFTSAGGHFNPHNRQHGLENPNGAHAGDLPNLEVNAGGRGFMQMTTALVTLGAGPNSVFDADGSAVVIHASADDQRTDPTGNSGGRIACGVLQAPPR